MTSLRLPDTIGPNIKKFWNSVWITNKELLKELNIEVIYLDDLLKFREKNPYDFYESPYILMSSIELVKEQFEWIETRIRISRNEI